jgi:hypothetical protein
LEVILNSYLPGFQLSTIHDLIEMVKLFSLRDPDSYLRSASVMELQVKVKIM